jgi:hypothetical protein
MLSARESAGRFGGRELGVFLAGFSVVAVALLHAGGQAQMTPAACFEQVVGPVGPQNPRNSEAAIVPLAGDLLAIWNHNPGAGKRNPLTAAVSTDEGETWTRFKDLEDAPDDAWAYPAVTWVGEVALVTYFSYKGGLSLKLRGLPAAWFYER